jgi:hypothetical protein
LRERLADTQTTIACAITAGGEHASIAAAK